MVYPYSLSSRVRYVYGNTAIPSVCSIHKKLGWTTEKIGKYTIFIKSFFFMGAIGKLQRTTTLPSYKKVIALIKNTVSNYSSLNQTVKYLQKLFHFGLTILSHMYEFLLHITFQRKQFVWILRHQKKTSFISFKKLNAEQ